MFKQSYILFKEFLPKEIELNKHITRQTANLASFTKSLPKQLKNTSLQQFKQTPQEKEHFSFSKPFSQQYYSSKKVLKLKSRNNLSHVSSAKISQHSNRTEHEFMDDNVWKHLSKSKSKRFEDLAKELPRKIHKPHMAIIFKNNKQSIENQNDFVNRNLSALRKIVKSQSQERHHKEMIHFDIINTKRAHLRSNLRKHDEKQKLIRRQEQSQLKLKMLSKISQPKQANQKVIVQQLINGEKKSNPQKQGQREVEVRSDLTASKVVLQKKTSLKKDLIQKIRKERNERREQNSKAIKEDRKYLSTYLTENDQPKIPRNLTFHIKRRFKTQISDMEKKVTNNTQKCQNKRNQWEEFISKAIEPW